MKVEYRQIDFGKGNYYITSHGRVLNNESNKYLKNQYRIDSRGGYKSVKIVLTQRRGRGKKINTKCICISKLMGLAFISNPNNYTEIDHINRNSLDNRLENLRWVNKTEQNFNKGSYKNNRLGEKYIRRLKDGRYKVERIDSRHNIQRYFKTLNEAIIFRNKLISINI